MFKEITAIEEYTQNEIMIHVDMRDGDILEAYAYVDGIPEIYIESKEEDRPCRNYKMKNPLFRRLHLGDVKKVPLFVLLEEPDSEHYNEEENEFIIIALQKFSNLIEVG